MAKEMKNTPMKVTRIKNVTSEQVNANGDEITKELHTLTLVAKDGVTKATLVSPEPWKGISRKSVLDIVVLNSQTQLTEFEQPKKGAKKKETGLPGH